jgi:hypothetical protein
MADQSATSKFMKSSLEQFIKAARLTGMFASTKEFDPRDSSHIVLAFDAIRDLGPVARR